MSDSVSGAIPDSVSGAAQHVAGGMQNAMDRAGQCGVPRP